MKSNTVELETHRHTTKEVNQFDIQKRIVVAPNEDGLGPSSLAFYVVVELLDRIKQKQDDRHGNVGVSIRNKKKEHYNRTLYKSSILTNLVKIEPVHNIIELGKKSGRVGFEESLANLLRYPSLTQIYTTIPLNDRNEKCLAVIDIGVPSLVRAAWMRSLPAITIFDHRWGLTFERIADLYMDDETFLSGEKRLGQHVLDAINVMKEDEAKTNLVFLFPTFLTPQEYHASWRQDTKARVFDIAGVFGGGPRLIAKLRDAVIERLTGSLSDEMDGHQEDVVKIMKKAGEKASDLRKSLTDWLTDQRQRKLESIPQMHDLELIAEDKATDIKGAKLNLASTTVDQQAKGILKDYIETVIVRYLLGIDNFDPIVFTSGGGTEVWTDSMWERIIRKTLSMEETNSLRFNLILCPTDKAAAKFGVPEDRPDRIEAANKGDLQSIGVQVWAPKFQSGNSKGEESKRVRFLGDVTEGTYQEIFHGVDLIVSRAGGATANDAIACETPMCCVEEPGHWQVENIRQNMEKAGLTRTISLEEFRINPVGILEREVLERGEDNIRIKLAMEKIPKGRERFVVDTILDFLFDRTEFFQRYLEELQERR